MKTQQYAKEGNIFVLTEKGYAETPDRVKPERKVGEPIRGFEESVPGSWVGKGYVKEITSTASVRRQLEENKERVKENEKNKDLGGRTNSQHNREAR